MLSRQDTNSKVRPWDYIYIVLLVLGLSGSALATGYQIPNQSVTAVGIAGAHVAYTPGPDAAYYNPANMTFLEDTYQIEASLTTLALPSTKYSDHRSTFFDGSSDSELFFLPQIHLTSKKYDDFHFGFSLTYPYGLAKQWEQPFPRATAEHFSLFTVEANPSFSYSFADFLSVGGGLRLLYGQGEARNGITNPPFSQLSPLSHLSRKMEGDDWQLGYNLAASIRPTPGLSIAATYRSETEFDLQGDASLQAQAGQLSLLNYDGSASLKVPLPAVLSMALAYSFDDLTLEFTWNKTFWSALDQLDFQYSQSFIGTPFHDFDQPLAKNWSDSDAWRFGLTYALTNSLTTTLGFAIDNTPVPESTLGFEMPDSDALMYSAGLQYVQSGNLTLALSYMYHYTRSRFVHNQPSPGFPGLDGTFTGGGAHAVTLGMVYMF